MESKQPIVNEETECCPKFEPERWDEKTLEWKNKKFVKGSVCTFMYMPLNFGAVMRKLDTKNTKFRCIHATGRNGTVRSYFCLENGCLSGCGPRSGRT